MFFTPNSTLQDCESLSLNVSASLDIIRNISLIVQAGSITIENVNATFSHLSLTSHWTNGTSLDNVQFVFARLYTLEGPTSVSNVEGIGLHIVSSNDTISVRDTVLEGMFVQTSSTNDITIQQLSTQRLTAVAQEGTMYIGVDILEPPESAEGCGVNITSQSGTVLLTTTLYSNKSCIFTSTLDQGDFTGSFHNFQGFYTVEVPIGHSNIPHTSCTTNSTTQLKTCIGEVGSVLPTERSLSGPTHLIYLRVLLGLVTLNFD